MSACPDFANCDNSGSGKYDNLDALLDARGLGEYKEVLRSQGLDLLILEQINDKFSALEDTLDKAGITEVGEKRASASQATGGPLPPVRGAGGPLLECLIRYLSSF